MYISAKPENCHSLFKRGYTSSGIMTIHPWDECDRNYRSVDVFCDMDTSGGGWTVSMTLKIAVMLTEYRNPKVKLKLLDVHVRYSKLK